MRPPLPAQQDQPEGPFTSQTDPSPHTSLLFWPECDFHGHEPGLGVGTGRDGLGEGVGVGCGRELAPAVSLQFSFGL